MRHIFRLIIRNQTEAEAVLIEIETYYQSLIHLYKLNYPLLNTRLCSQIDANTSIGRNSIQSERDFEETYLVVL